MGAAERMAAVTAEAMAEAAMAAALAEGMVEEDLEEEMAVAAKEVATVAVRVGTVAVREEGVRVEEATEAVVKVVRREVAMGGVVAAGTAGRRTVLWEAKAAEARVVVAVREAVAMVAVAHRVETLAPRQSAQIHRCQ